MITALRHHVTVYLKRCSFRCCSCSGCCCSRCVTVVSVSTCSTHARAATYHAKSCDCRANTDAALPAHELSDDSYDSDACANNAHSGEIDDTDDDDFHVDTAYSGCSTVCKNNALAPVYSSSSDSDADAVQRHARVSAKQRVTATDTVDTSMVANTDSSNTLRVYRITALQTRSKTATACYRQWHLQ
jgi:hypothetical protein